MPRASLPVPASLMRPTWPSPRRSLNAALALPRSKLPSASTSVSVFLCHTHIICAAFSSSVMRDRRSLARFAAGRSGLRYGAILVPLLLLLRFAGRFIRFVSIQRFVSFERGFSNPRGRCGHKLWPDQGALSDHLLMPFLILSSVGSGPMLSQTASGVRFWYMVGARHFCVDCQRSKMRLLVGCKPNPVTAM